MADATIDRAHGRYGIVAPAVDAWLDALQPVGDAVHDAMVAEAQARGGFPIIGPQVGRFVELLARGVGARRVFELGSGFGYSAWWFARAVGPGGQIVCTNLDGANVAKGRAFLERAGVGERVQWRVGSALDALRADTSGPWDVVFSDIDKQDYPQVVDLALGKLRPGGLLITDNALWSGRVADPAVHDAGTEGVRAYAHAVAARKDAVTSILPVRDGVAVTLKL